MMSGELWYWECEAAGHSLSAVRKQREVNAAVPFLSPFLFSLGFTPRAWSHPSSGCLFNSVKPLWKLPHRHTWRWVSQEDFSHVKWESRLTITDGGCLCPIHFIIYEQTRRKGVGKTAIVLALSLKNKIKQKPSFLCRSWLSAGTGYQMHFCKMIQFSSRCGIQGRQTFEIVWVSGMVRIGRVLTL